MSLDYPKLTAFLIEVAKAQQREIEALREATTSELMTLRGEIAELASQVRKLRGQ